MNNCFFVTRFGPTRHGSLRVSSTVTYGCHNAIGARFAALQTPQKQKKAGIYVNINLEGSAAPGGAGREALRGEKRDGAGKKVAKKRPDRQHIGEL